MIGADKLTEQEKANVIKLFCLKAILYISKSTVYSEELNSKVLAAFAGLPTLVVRVNTLPKNAPVELEMIAMVTKREY